MADKSTYEGIELSLYGQYIQERLGKHIIEDANGFATYSFTNDSVYIEDIYVVPSHRKSGVAASYADRIAAQAVEKGITTLYGTVVPSANGATEGLKCFLQYGFSVDSATTNFIVLKKRLS